MAILAVYLFCEYKEREEWICLVPEDMEDTEDTVAPEVVEAPVVDIGEAPVGLWAADPMAVAPLWAVCLLWVTDPHHPTTEDTATAGAAVGR